MKSRRQGLARAAAILAGLSTLLLLAPVAGARVPDPEILIEGGAVMPGGDLDRAYSLLDGGTGFGAETGYEVGARFRYWFAGNWAISPSFHYADFGDFLGYSSELGGDFAIGTSVVRYGADVQAFLGDPGQDLRLYVTAGAGLYHNRYRDELVEDTGYGDYSYAEESFDNLGFDLGGGIRMGEFEFSAVYHLNRFQTSRLLPSASKVDFDWDYVSVRFGFAFPTE